MLLQEMTSDRLKEIFDFNGKNLIWKDRPTETFASKNAASRWRGKNLGKVAGAIDKSSGYRKITFSKKTSLAHRVVWSLVNGTIDKNSFIDHKDGDKDNNSIDNLRLCTNTENQFNSKTTKRNTSGEKGVSFYAKSRKWAGELNVCGFRVRKLFECREDALIFVKSEREKLHKEFANHGNGSVLLNKE